MTELDMIVEKINDQLHTARQNCNFFEYDEDMLGFLRGRIDALMDAKRLVREAQFEIMKNSSCMEY
jgi:hypothetical protein